MDTKAYSKDVVGFRVETKAGKMIFVIERQIPGHDKQYKVGSKIPGRGKVVEVLGRGEA